MSDATPTPSSGEEIHLPGPSLHPLLLALGITVALLGVTTSIFMLIAGLVLTVTIIVLWIRATRREIAELPAEH